MTFISDPVMLRTYDTSRGIELRAVSGGSDGSKSFEIFDISNPHDVLTAFTAILISYDRSRFPEIDDHQINEISVWNLLTANSSRFEMPNLDRSETLAVIKEAFLSYKSVHGMGSPNTKYLYEISENFKM